MSVAESFAEASGQHDAAREHALQQVLARVAAQDIRLVRIAWCDVHGLLRGKTVTVAALERAMRQGIGMVSTLMLKDTSDRTAYKVFEPDGVAKLPGFGQANNLVLLPDPARFVSLPWSPGSGWMPAQPWFQDATPVTLDTRHQLQRALQRLHDRGMGLRCGLEVELHIYRLVGTQAQLDPAQAAWPGPAPEVALIHPGYQLLGEAWYDMAEEPLRIIEQTARALDLPLTSLEVELGPSQVEAVFDATDALTAADNMVLFRSAVRSALRRAGYHATFMCRPPFPNIMASGWHLHQSLVDAASGRNLFCRETSAPDSTPLDAGHRLSDIGEHHLAGLLAHARGMSVFATPTANGYGRFKPNALAPQQVQWGHDNRGAMLRVVGAAGDPATHIENRAGEPAANPYLYIASQVHAGLDGLERRLRAPQATRSPYDAGGEPLPSSLPEALSALRGDAAMVGCFGEAFVDYLCRIKQSEATRHADADDLPEFERREYFSRL